MASASSDIDVALDELEARLERLRALYEQYFIGIEKLEPSVPRQDVDRRIYALRKVQIRNTAKRFKLQTIIQRYNTFQQYWLRICREIENGTYHRHVARAQSRFGDVPLSAAARRRARLQGQNQTDEQKALSEEKARAQKEADDDLEALLGEDLDVALSRALLAADDVEITRGDPPTPSAALEAPPVANAEVAQPKVASVGPPRPKMVSTVEAGSPARSLASKPPPRTKPAVAATTEVADAPRSPAEAAPARAQTTSLKPPAGESPATLDRPGVAVASPARKEPIAAADAAAAKPPARNAAPTAKRSPDVAASAPLAGAATPPVRGAEPPQGAGANTRAAVGVPAAAPAAAAPPKAPALAPAAPPATPAAAAAAPPAAAEKGAQKSAAAGAGPGAARPVDKGKRAKQAASSKAKPAAPAGKAPERDAWAALRMPPEQRQARALQPTGGEVPGAANAARPAKATADARPAGRSPPKAEPAGAEASAKAPAPAARAAQPSPAQAAPASTAAEPKIVEPKPAAPGGVAVRAPAPVTTAAPAPVTTAAPAPRAPAEPHAETTSPDARAAAGRAAAARAAEIRSQAQAAPQGAGLDDQRLSQLHGALVAERRRLNQPGKVSKDALAASLRDTESKLRQQYGDKQIDFHVVVKDGKAVVKPIVG